MLLPNKLYFSKIFASGIILIWFLFSIYISLLNSIYISWIDLIHSRPCSLQINSGDHFCLRLILLWWNTITKETWWGKGLFCLQFDITVYQWLSEWEHKQVRNLEARSHAEATEEYCLLACFLWLAQPAFFNRTQDHRPRDGTTYNGLSPLLSITN